MFLPTLIILILERVSQVLGDVSFINPPNVTTGYLISPDGAIGRGSSFDVAWHFELPTYNASEWQYYSLSLWNANNSGLYVFYNETSAFPSVNEISCVLGDNLHDFLTESPVLYFELCPTSAAPGDLDDYTDCVDSQEFVISEGLPTSTIGVSDAAYTSYEPTSTWSTSFSQAATSGTLSTTTISALATLSHPTTLTPTATVAPSTPPVSVASVAPTASPEPHGLSQKDKIGVGVGVGLGIPALALAGFLAWFLMRRRRQTEIKGPDRLATETKELQ
ncbi:hypothetical protein LTR17_025743 [Elasticomyces elasticus]|nr:hypothetical protein LTR17_025743 [Elasticomyces elasticus]